MSIFIPIPLGRIICHAVLHSSSWQVDRDFLALNLNVFPPFSRYFPKRTPLLHHPTTYLSFHIHVLNHSVGTWPIHDSLSSAWDSFIKCYGMYMYCTGVDCYRPAHQLDRKRTRTRVLHLYIHRKSAIISDYKI